MIVNYKEAGVLFAFVTSTEKQSHIYTKKHDHQAVKRLMTVFRSGFFSYFSFIDRKHGSFGDRTRPLETRSDQLTKHYLVLFSS